MSPLKPLPLRPFHLETSPGLGSADFGSAVEVVESAASYFGKVPKTEKILNELFSFMVYCLMVDDLFYSNL